MQNKLVKWASIVTMAILVFLCSFAMCVPVGSAQNKGGASNVAGRTYQGESIECDLPNDLHMKNIGSRIDGAGMCVMSSIEMASRWQNIDDAAGIREYAAGFPGGGWPEKVDRQIEAYFKQKGKPAPAYVQYDGTNPEPILRAALDSGRMAAITYGWSPRYGQKIAHMVNLVKYNGQYAVVLDNNFPGDEKYEWMSLQELVRRCTYPDGYGWVFVWLAPPPPPSPRNLSK